MTRVLHVFYNFLPDVTGSSIRSAGVLAGQRANGIEVIAVSSPFQPGYGQSLVEDVGGIRCYRSFRAGNPAISERGASLRTRLRKLWLFASFSRDVARIAREERATHIHAHSTFFTALAALIAGLRLRLPVVYEFRSLWEERSRRLGLSYRIQSYLATLAESFALRRVSSVVTINEGLRRELSRRGIPRERIAVVPNAVENAVIDEGSALPPPQSARRFGYIGNLSDIEGLDLLVDAFRSAFPLERNDVSLVFHGDGPFAGALRSQIGASNDPRISMAGRFGRVDLARVYASVDCVVIPRRRMRLTESVTPLKPLEAMAFSRLVIISDVAGLTEVVGGDRNALVVAADSTAALARALADAAANDIAVAETAAAGRRFVVKERNWDGVARLYSTVYA